jgi:predicted DNA-binding ribbon-helix-helix protein
MAGRPAIAEQPTQKGFTLDKKYWDMLHEMAEVKELSIAEMLRNIIERRHNSFKTTLDKKAQALTT